MGRVERRQYRRGRSRQAVVRLLLALTVLVIGSGLYQRWSMHASLTVDRVPDPTVTPVPADYDESVVARETILPEETWYAIQTGVFTQADAAKARADAYADRGAPGIVAQEGERYRVFIAAFRDKADAASVREKLNAQQAVETYLYPWVCPAVTLRLSGMAGQLDVVQSGLSMALQAAALLRDYATAYDQGGVTAEDVTSLISGLDSQFALWQDTASRRFDKPYPAVLAAEMALADAWHSAGREILKAGTATDMSAAMKVQAMLLYARVIDMRQSLESQ